MNSKKRTGSDQEVFLDNFAADLAEAAYRTALRHGVGGSSIDLELDLWHVLDETVQKWGREVAPCP